MSIDYVDSNLLPFNPNSIPDPSPMHHHHRAPSKPNGGTRFLVLVLQALVMAIALLLFFLFAGIAALVLVHLFIAGRSLRRRRRRRQDHRPCENGPGQGLSPEELKAITCSRYVSKGKHAAALMWGPECAVCLEGFRDGDLYRVMPKCGHAFHKGCVDRWLVKTPMCPICRAEVGGGR